MFTSEQITIGFKRASEWFIPVAVTQYIPIINENIIKKKILQNDLSLSESFIECSELTNIDCSGSFEYFLHFWNSNNNNILPYMLYLAMGDNTLIDLNAVVGKRILKLSNNIYGKFSTLAINKIIAVHELPSVKFNGFKIYGNINNILTIQFNTLCNDRNINSTINTLTLLRTLENEQQINADDLIPITLLYGEFLIDEYGQTLTNEYGISEIDFTFNRNISGDFVVNKNNLNQIIEPIQNGENEITLNLTLPYYDTLKFIENFDLQTFKHATLTFIGPTIFDSLGNNYRFTFKINFYKMKIINEEDIINNLGLVPQVLKFQLLNDGINKPFDIEIISFDKQNFS